MEAVEKMAYKIRFFKIINEKKILTKKHKSQMVRSSAQHIQ